jgi:hypothetical protein
VLSPPPAHEIRPSGNGCISAQDGEEVGIIDWTLYTASFWKLETVKPTSMNAQPAHIRNNTNHGVCEVIGYDAQSARRELSNGRVTKSKLFDKEGFATKHLGGFSRARERRDRAGLAIVVVRLRDN